MSSSTPINATEFPPSPKIEDQRPPADWLMWLVQMDWQPMLASTAIAFPFVLLYLAELAILIANWHSIGSSFFLLFNIRAFLDLAHFLCSFFNFRLPLLGFFHDWFQSLPGWLLCIFYWSKTYLISASNLTTVFMIFNRWSAISRPIQHKNIWRRAMFPAFLAIILIPLTYTGHMFGYTVYVKMQTDNRKFLLWDTGIDTGNKPNDTLIVAATMLGFMLFTGAINIRVISIFIRRKAEANPNNKETAKIEQKLTIYSLATFLGYFLHSLYYFCMYLGFYKFAEWGLCRPFVCTMIAVAILNQNSLLNDLTHLLLPPLLMLWASDFIRIRLAHFLLKMIGRSNMIPTRITILSQMSTAKLANATTTNGRQLFKNNFV